MRELWLEEVQGLHLDFQSPLTIPGAEPRTKVVAEKFVELERTVHRVNARRGVEQDPPFTTIARLRPSARVLGTLEDDWLLLLRTDDDRPSPLLNH